MKEETSEFGKGLTYCIGLFLAHSERKQMSYGLSKKNDYRMWFNGAADHLYEMQIPDNLSPKLFSRLEKFQDFCIAYRLNPACTKDDFEWAINEAKLLLLEIDKSYGIPTLKAEYN